MNRTIVLSLVFICGFSVHAAQQGSDTLTENRFVVPEVSLLRFVAKQCPNDLYLMMIANLAGSDSLRLAGTRSRKDSLPFFAGSAHPRLQRCAELMRRAALRRCVEPARRAVGPGGSVYILGPLARRNLPSEESWDAESVAEKKQCIPKLICAAQKEQRLARTLQCQQRQRRHQNPPARRRGLNNQGQPKSRKGRRRYN